MINKVIVAPHLWANIDNVGETSSFIKAVLCEYLRKLAPRKFQDINSSLFTSNLCTLINNAIKNKNPEFIHTVKVSVQWECVNKEFWASVYIGIEDFNLPAHGINAVECSNYYQ